MFPDGITRDGTLRRSAVDPRMPAEGVVPELQWEGCRRAQPRMADFVSMAAERAADSLRFRSSGGPKTGVERSAGRRARDRWPDFHGAVGATSGFPSTSEYDPIGRVAEADGPADHFHSGPAPYRILRPDSPRTPGQPELPGAMGSRVEVVMWKTCGRSRSDLGWRVRRFPKSKVAITEGRTGGLPAYLPPARTSASRRRTRQKLGDYRSHGRSCCSTSRAKGGSVGGQPGASDAAPRGSGLPHIMWGHRLPDRGKLAAHALSGAGGGGQIETFSGRPTPRSRRCSAANRHAIRLSTPRSSSRSWPDRAAKRGCPTARIPPPRRPPHDPIR